MALWRLETPSSLTKEGEQELQDSLHGGSAA